MKYIHLCLSVLFIFSILLCSSPINTNAQTSAVKLHIDHTEGTVDSKIIVTGENFPGTAANIYWDGTAIARGINISQDGRFSHELVIPAASHGQHIISADDNSNWAGAKAQTTFYILPSISIFPKVVSMSTPIFIKGNGFPNNDRGIQIALNGNVLKTGQISADHNGYWSASYTVYDLPYGKHTISAFSTAVAASESNMETFILAPWLEVSPDTGPVGTKLQIYGWGFRHNEDGITVTWDGEIIKVNIRAEVDGSLIVDGSKREYGTFTTSNEHHEVVYVPPTTKGPHIVGVYGSSFTPRGTLPSYTFTVTPEIRINPAKGQKGTWINIDGNGFNNQETISLKYNTIEFTEIITDNKGGFSIQFIIPQSSSIDNLISATGNKGSSASTKFHMDKIDIGIPIIESPQNGERASLFNSVGEVYIGSIRYIIGLGDFLKGKIAVDNGNSITIFKWHSDNTSNDTKYTLQISPDNSFKSIQLEKLVNNNHYDLTFLDGLQSGKYYWRVKSTNLNNAESEWSQISHFELTPMPIRTAIFSIIVLILIITAIVFIIILLWIRSVNRYRY